jgi:hypothetical protein
VSYRCLLKTSFEATQAVRYLKRHVEVTVQKSLPIGLGWSEASIREWTCDGPPTEMSPKDGPFATAKEAYAGHCNRLEVHTYHHNELKMDKCRIFD